MFFNGWRIYEDVVQVDMDEPGDVVAEHRCHQPLERGGGVTVPLLHYSTHEGAKYGGECGLWYILRFNVYLFICLQHVQLGPVGSTSDIMPDCFLIRKGQDILFRLLFCIWRSNTVCSLPLFFNTQSMGTACRVVVGTHHLALV